MTMFSKDDYIYENEKYKQHISFREFDFYNIYSSLHSKLTQGQIITVVAFCNKQVIKLIKFEQSRNTKVLGRDRQKQGHISDNFTDYTSDL